MNTEGELPKPLAVNPFFASLFANEPSEADKALDAVQQELAAEKDARKEDKFFWACGFILLVDIFTFPAMQTWAAPVVIGFLEFIVIIALGRRAGVDSIWTLTERIIDRWDGKVR